MTKRVYHNAKQPNRLDTIQRLTARQKKRAAWSLGNELQPTKVFGSDP